MTGGQTLVDPDAHSNTMSELRKRAQQLGVKGRSRMKKAELAEAVARKEMDTLSITSPQSAVQESTEQGVQSATQQVRTAVRTAAEQGVQSATQQVREADRSATQVSGQGTVQPDRAARRRSESGWRRMGRNLRRAISTVLIALLTSLVTSLDISRGSSKMPADLG